MTQPETRKCTDCDGGMHAVKVLDRGQPYYTDQAFEYTTLDDVASWTGAFRSATVVRAFICEKCGLIKLYGVPKE